MTGTISTSDATVEALDLYAKFTVGTASNAVAFTTTDGYCYAIVNGYLQHATDPGLEAKYAYVEISFEGWYKEAACTNAADADQLARIAADSSVKVYVGGGARARTALSAPSTLGDFASTFGNTLNNRSEITFTFNAGGSVKTGNNTKVYVAISGEEDLKTNAQMDALVGTNSGFKDDGDGDTKVTTTVTVYPTAS